MKKVLLTTVLIAGTLLVGCQYLQEDPEAAENYNESPEKEVVEISVDKEGSNPFGYDITQEALTDYDFQSYIHGMSHQKVEAEDKWTFYELKPERVEWLLGTLDKAEGIENKSEYKRILNKWSQGDFSTADEDHNKVWNMLGGTVGRATGISSKEEEQAYLDNAN